MRRFTFVLPGLIALVLVAACGGGKSNDRASATGSGSAAPSATGPAAATGSAAATEPAAGSATGSATAALPPALATFHRKLAAVRAASPGKERTVRACSDAEVLGMDLEAVVKEGAPKGADAASWAKQNDALLMAWTPLSENCMNNDGESFDELFVKVTVALDAVVALVP